MSGSRNFFMANDTIDRLEILSVQGLRIGRGNMDIDIEWLSGEVRLEKKKIYVTPQLRESHHHHHYRYNTFFRARRRRYSRDTPIYQRRQFLGGF